MSHMIYLKLREEELFLQAEQINFFTQNGQFWKKIILLSEKIWHFVSLFSF